MFFHLRRFYAIGTFVCKSHKNADRITNPQVEKHKQIHMEMTKMKTVGTQPLPSKFEQAYLIQDHTQSLVKKFQREIGRLRKEEKIDKQIFYSMYPSNAVLPRLYGLIKAHKPAKNYPM